MLRRGKESAKIDFIAAGELMGVTLFINTDQSFILLEHDDRYSQLDDMDGGRSEPGQGQGGDPGRSASPREGCGMSEAPNMVGTVFGLLTVVAETRHKSRSGKFFICRCQCGTEKTLYAGHLKAGNVRSCGCGPKPSPKTHGMSQTPEYKAWDNARHRCATPQTKNTRFTARAESPCASGGRTVLRTFSQTWVRGQVAAIPLSAKTALEITNLTIAFGQLQKNRTIIGRSTAT
jgi:hypothetical protein